MAAQFSWAAAADVATGVAGAISSWGTASANKIVAKANAEAQRVIRDAQNRQRASATTLAGAMRGIAYRAALGNAGDSMNDANTLIARSQEAWTRGNLEMGLKNAEQIGALAARSAAAGVGGASVRAVSYTTQLQQDRLSERMAERQQESMYEMVKARSGIMPAAVSRLDVSPLNPNIDYTPTFDPTAGNSANLLGFLTEGLFSKAKSLQVALDSLDSGPAETPGLTTGDFARMDRANTPSITID